MVELIGFGSGVTRQSIENRMGSAVQSVYTGLQQLVNLQADITTIGDATLTTLGYDATALAELKSVLVDMVNASKVLNGQQAQPAASNFFFNATQYGVTGLV